MKQNKQGLQIISMHKHNAFIFKLNQFLNSQSLFWNPKKIPNSQF